MNESSTNSGDLTEDQELAIMDPMALRAEAAEMRDKLNAHNRNEEKLPPAEYLRVLRRSLSITYLLNQSSAGPKKKKEPGEKSSRRSTKKAVADAPLNLSLDEL